MRRVVITGMGLVTPLANGREASWKKLIAGESGLGRIDIFDTSDLACKIAGQVPWVTGRGGGLMPELCDHCLRTPSDETPRIQEGHIAMGHTICWLIERAIFPRDAALGAAA